MTEITSTSPRAMQTLLDGLFSAPSEQPFVTMWKSEQDIESVTFGEFRERALAFAAYLQTLGVQKGDTVVLIMPQGVPLMTAFISAMALGSIPAILAYPNFKVEPAKYRFGLKGVTANLKASVILIDEDFPEHLTRDVAGDRVRLVRYDQKNTSISHSLEIPDIEPSQIAFIQHSAGTTGLQKGVALSHQAVLTHVNRLAPALRIAQQDRIYSWLPLYHDMGLIACFMLPLVCHLPVVMQSPTDWVIQPRTMIELISAYRCTLAWIPNFTLQFLARRVRSEDRASADLSCLRTLINCSEPVRASSMDEFIGSYSQSGLNAGALQSCYAMAETVFAVTQSDVTGNGPRRIWVESDSFRKQEKILLVPATDSRAICFVSSGTCLPETQVRIVSNSGTELGPGLVGEILIKSDTLLDGYYNRPDLTSKVLQGGWYWSGDLGFLLDNELYVVGRKKDLIIVAGENVYPQDVEEIVSTHPAIYAGRVVAFGHFNPALGTEEVAVVAEVRREEDMGKRDEIDRALRKAIRSELGIRVGSIFLKPPRWIVKSTAGKPARSATREKLLSKHAEV